MSSAGSSAQVVAHRILRKYARRRLSRASRALRMTRASAAKVSLDALTRLRARSDDLPAMLREQTQVALVQRPLIDEVGLVRDEDERHRAERAL